MNEERIEASGKEAAWTGRVTKKRVSISKKVENDVLTEYQHLCAVCRKPRPQLHHIDEDPSNNDPLNLLPLCPNNHLQDVHNPTQPVDQRKVKLFRRYKDPLILDARFEPLFRRLTLLRDKDTRSNRPWLYKNNVNDFLDFVGALQMGKFYRDKMMDMLRRPSTYYRSEQISRQGAGPVEDSNFSQKAFEYAIDRAEGLAIEMLRYQGWAAKPFQQHKPAPE